MAARLAISSLAPVTATAAQAETATGVLLAQGATATSPLASGFGGGQLSVQLAGASTADMLSLEPGGAVTLIGTRVLVSGIAVGVVSGGVSGAPLVVRFTAASVTNAQASAVLDAVAFQSQSSSPSTAARSVSFTLSAPGLGSVNASNLLTVTAPIAAPSSPPPPSPPPPSSPPPSSSPPPAATPVLNGLASVSAALTTPQAAAGVALAASATLSSAAAAGLAGGTLVAHLAGATSADTLGLAAVHGVTLSGASVLVNGVVVGAVSGGQAGADLQISFSAAKVTSAQATAVLEAVYLSSTAPTPPAGARAVTFTAADAAGHAASQSANVTLQHVDSPPVLTGLAGSLSVQESVAKTTGVLVAPNLQASNPDQTGFGGGAIVVHLAGAGASDVLSLAPTSAVSLQGGVVMVAGQPVATLSGGSSGVDLTIALAAGVSDAVVSQVLQALSYHDLTSAPNPAARVLSITVTDHDGDSSVASLNLGVVPTDDAPVFAGLPSGTQSLAPGVLQGAAGLSPAASATVSNPDATGFAGGRLTVHLTGGGTADTLSLVGSGALGVVGSTLSYSGRTVGTVSGGARGADLVVTLSSTGGATDAVASAILQAVRLHAAAAATQPLTASFTYVDHEGDSATASVVFSPNQAPTGVTLTSLSSAIKEHVAVGAGVEVATIAVADDGLGSNTLSLSGADAADFAIRTDAQGRTALYYVGPSPDYAIQSAYHVTVSAQDQTLSASSPVSAAYTLNVADVHTAPTSVQFSSVTHAIPEHSAVGAGGVEVATLGVTGDDLANVSFGLSGPDAASFSVHADGQGHPALFYTGASPSYAAQSFYSVTVSASDAQVSGAAPASSAFTLSVTQVNEAPTAVTATPLMASLPENTAVGSGIEVAVVSVADDGLGTNSLSLSGADAADFALRTDPHGRQGLYYVGPSPDFETKASYAVTVTATDSSLPSSTPVSQAFTLAISDVNEAPTAVHLTSLVTSIGEGATVGAGIEVATVQVTDDALGSNICSVTGPDAADFVVQPDGAGQMALFYVGSSPSLAIQSAYHVTVQVQDPTLPQSAPVSQDFTLSVAAVNHAPTAVQFSNTVTSVADGVTVGSGIEVAQISVTDDGLGVNTLTVGGADKADFTIRTDASGAQGLFFTGPSPAYLTQASYTVSVNAQDASVLGSSPVSQVFSLAVTPVNHPPTAIGFQGTTTSIAQGTAVGSGVAVATLIVTDADNQYGSDTITLSGADASDFKIGTGPSNHQELYYVGPTSSVATYSVTVSVQDSTIAGSTAVSNTFSLGVIQSDQPPTAVVLSATSATLAENTAIGTGVLMANVSATDDGLGTNSFALTGSDAASFSLVNTGGQEQLYYTGASPNYEAKSSYSVTVEAFDAALPQSSPVYRTFTLAVTNVNEAPAIVAPTSSFSVTGALPIFLTGVQVSDPEGDSQTVVLSAQNGLLVLPASSGVSGSGTAASLTLSGTQTALNQALSHLEYQPKSGFTGADTVAITSTDSHGLQGATTDLTVNVQPGPLTPVQVTDIYRSGQTSSSATGSALTGASTGETIAGLSQGSTQATASGAGASTTYTLAGAYGTLVLHQDGDFTYTSTAAGDGAAIAAVHGSHPSESFTFTAHVGGATQTGTLNVEVDRPPSPANLTADVTQSGAVTVAGAAPSLIGQPSDADGDAVTVSAIAHGGGASAAVGAGGVDIAGSYGELHVNADGSYSYVPDQGNTAVSGLTHGQSVTDAFTYTLDDGQGGQASATLDVAVNGPGPFASDHTDAVAGYTHSVAGNLVSEQAASNPGGASPTLTQIQGQAVAAGGTTVTDSIGGHLLVAPDGSYTYTTPASLSFDGDQKESFSYMVSDGATHTASADLIIDVTNPIYVSQSETLSGTNSSGGFHIDAQDGGSSYAVGVSVTATGDAGKLSSATLLSWLTMSSNGSPVDASHPLTSSTATVTESFTGASGYSGDSVTYSIAIHDAGGDVAYHSLVVTL